MEYSAERATLCLEAMRRPQDFPKATQLTYASELVVRAYSGTYKGQTAMVPYIYGETTSIMLGGKSRKIDTLTNIDPELLGNPNATTIKEAAGPDYCEEVWI